MNKFILEYIFYFLLALGISFVISYIAYKKKSLSLSGFYASIVIGTTIILCGGVYFTSILLLFFVSSSLLSTLQKVEKVDSLRTYKQVLANGLIGAVLVVLYAVYEDDTFKLLFTVSFAISTADTWASEVGKLSKSTPRNILSWRPMETGLSGGITLLGTAASLVGSIVISAFYRFHPLIILGGFTGSIIDSILGTAQVKYVTKDGLVLENRPEDGEYDHISGLWFLSNNMVNFISNGMVIVVLFFFEWYKMIE